MLPDAAAMEGRAGFVVAGDSDLLDLKEYEGIRIVNPRMFLNLVAEVLDGRFGVTRT